MKINDYIIYMKNETLITTTYNESSSSDSKKMSSKDDCRKIRMITCTTCKKRKPRSDFPNIENRDYRCHTCLVRIENNNIKIQEIYRLLTEGKKKCTVCGEIKTLDHFYKKSVSTQGYQSECKECSKKKREKYLNSLTDELKEERRKRYNSRRVEIEKCNRTPEREEWMILRNKIAELREQGLKKCTKCNKIKPLSEFRYRKGRGYDSYCNKCKSRLDTVRKGGISKEEQKELYEKGLKRCNTCKQVKALSEFYPESEKNIKSYHSPSFYVRGSCKECELTNQKKRRSAPKGKLGNAMQSALYKSLKGNKKNCGWERIVGYTVDKLKLHLESKFKKGMSWNNYGSEWHIDHIRPIASFSFSSFKEKEFLECWSLGNLQPLWAEENLKKG
jgi:hypothetical protein